MASDRQQRLVFDYLRKRFRDQLPFEKKELATAASWKDSSFTTYWSKQFKHFFVPANRGKPERFRVGEAFRPYVTWEKFRKHVTQVRGISSQYTAFAHDNIIVFEFFMPLSNEEHLRTSLDALFYKDTVLARLRSVESDKLARHFPRGAKGDSAYFDEVVDWIGKHFGGYSISHVAGRFREARIATLADAAEIQKDGIRYLIDETTAVVRFIFPCGSPSREAPLSLEAFDGTLDKPEMDSTSASVQAEAAKIRWVFGILFVQSIVQVVNGEAEIWMVESGMRNRLHIWRADATDA
jgi:hypothetical protein